MRALREQIGQPDYVGPRSFYGASGVRAAAQAARWGRPVTLHHFLVLSFDFVGEWLGWRAGGWGLGRGEGRGLVQNSDERRRRMSSSPAQPCVRRRHGNAGRSTPLHPPRATCFSRLLWCGSDLSWAASDGLLIRTKEQMGSTSCRAPPPCVSYMMMEGEENHSWDFCSSSSQDSEVIPKPELLITQQSVHPMRFSWRLPARMPQRSD